MKNSLFVILVMTLSGYAFADDEMNINESWDKYLTTATSIQDMIDSASLKVLADNSKQLTRLTHQMLPMFIAQEPVCYEYLTTALNASEHMLTLSLDEIEQDYHADGKLPAIKDAVCYHAKDLLVHPATMAVIASTLPDSKKTRKMLAHELEEVLEHFKQVRQKASS